MLQVVTADEIRELDRKANEDYGMPSATLMENAGWAVYKVIRRVLGGSVRGKKIAVFCGTGNNGGDGFVVARLLKIQGANVFPFLVGDPTKIKGDAKVYYDLLTKMMPLPAFQEENHGESGLFQVIVDALLGTGISGAPRPEYTEAIRWINLCAAEKNCKIISVDIPSGMDATTGEVPGGKSEGAVRADHTVTFAFPKWGLYLPPGDEYVGELHLADIGMDWSLLSISPKAVLSEAQTFDFLQKRRQESNKGDYGHVYIIGGSAGMSGAPAMAARAAQRSGAGLVTVLAPACVQLLIGAKLDEQMTIALPDEDGAVSEASFDKIVEATQRATVLCLGPGMTTKPGVVALVQRIIVEIDKPLILDADALNALAQNPEIALRRKENPHVPLILTPHPGEAARLLGTDTVTIQSNRRQSVLQLAQKYRAIVVLKGRFTLIADPEGNLRINPTGNPGMATGGSGDTLTGILGGLFAQYEVKRSQADDDNHSGSALDWIAVGVWIHGRAGDIAAAHFGEASLVAGDITTYLPRAMGELSTE